MSIETTMVAKTPNPAMAILEFVFGTSPAAEPSASAPNSAPSVACEPDAVTVAVVWAVCRSELFQFSWKRGAYSVRTEWRARLLSVR